MVSEHYWCDRWNREQVINQIGLGNVVKSVTVDRGHKNGAEIHKITDTGIIIIYNKKSGKLVTKLIARPNQIRRYYRHDEVVPIQLINVARQHQREGLNEI